MTANAAVALFVVDVFTKTLPSNGIFCNIFGTIASIRVGGVVTTQGCALNHNFYFEGRPTDAIDAFRAAIVTPLFVRVSRRENGPKKGRKSLYDD